MFTRDGMNLMSDRFDAIRNADNTDGVNVGGDQIWAPGNYRVEIIAHQSAGDSMFGFVPGVEGSDFQSLLDTDDIGSSTNVTLDEEFRWALQINRRFADDSVYTSLEADQDGRDMMVSYTLLRENGNYFGTALFFEDLIEGSDNDYNDVAVLLTLVPTPQAATMGGLALLGGMFGMRRRRLA